MAIGVEWDRRGLHYVDVRGDFTGWIRHRVDPFHRLTTTTHVQPAVIRESHREVQQGERAPRE